MAEPKIPIVANADNYKITANYENKVVIGEISYLTENFPEYYRPGDCIDVNIIRQAKALMQIKTLTLQQISDSLGFQNQSHFGTFFHRHTGLRPKAFRLNTFAHS